MAYIVPDSILEFQICSVCKKYLSYPPIKVYQNGDIKCGRCSHSDDGGAISKFETLAENMLFPCINRFEGCTKITHFMDVEEHETFCVGSVLECPVCEEEEVPLLLLTHHFRLDHPKSILKNCVVDISLASEFDKYFMHYDSKMNRIFLVFLYWDKVNLIAMCATVVNKKKQREVPKFRLSLFAVEETEKKLYNKDCECLNLINIIWNDKQGVCYRVPSYLTNILCKFTFHCNTSLFKKIGQFSCNNSITFEKNSKGQLPSNNLIKFEKSRELYQAYAKKSGYGQLKLSTCGTQLFSASCPYTIACGFCENYLAPEIYASHKDCSGRNVSPSQRCCICRTCYSYGVTSSLTYGSTLKPEVFSQYFLLAFYCRFGCKKFFQSKELFCHEDQCILNENRSLSEEEYMKVSFGREFIKSSKFSRENVMIFEPNKFKGKGRIFIVTKRDNFKCIIDYEQDAESKLCRFRINHKYDPNRYYISVHKWENKKFEFNYNDFSMMCENCEGPSLFAINIKQIET